jgi:hypothetical protein
MPRSDYLKLQRGAATNAKREEGGYGGEKGDHGRMCHDDYAKNPWYLRHLRVLSRHRDVAQDGRRLRANRPGI